MVFLADVTPVMTAAEYGKDEVLAAMLGAWVERHAHHDNHDEDVDNAANVVKAVDEDGGKDDRGSNGNSDPEDVVKKARHDGESDGVDGKTE